MKLGFSWRRAATTTAALLAAGALVVPATAADSGARVAIATVNGQDASSGSVALPVKGDVLTSTGTARTNAAPVADAGASTAVPSGQPAPLTGIASFGTAPYRFAWAYGGDAARFSNPTGASTDFDTTGITGPATITLTVTDANGDVDTDTVKVFAQGTTDTTLLDETREAGTGVPDEVFFGVGQDNDGGDEFFPFQVPKGTDTLDLSLSFTGGDIGANDFDLYVDDPSDREDANATGATGDQNPEHLHIADPATGSWTAIASAFASTGDTLHVGATAHTLVADPTPQLDAGGPYQFVEGDDQRLAARVTGGTAPYTVGWDLDGDNAFELPGASVLAGFPIGTHLATVKVTDAAGYEKRETLGVRVLPPGVPSPNPGLVVVAISDSGLNLYHEDFRATTFPDARTLALTNNFTRHPSEYLPGYPSDAKALNLTLGEEYYPAADHAVLASVEENKLYWIPGTKIVAAVDAGEATFVNSTAPDDVPLLDENGHGTGSASVAVGNIYGFCPTCLLAVTESSNNAWEYGTPWIDLASNSFGPQSNIGFAGLVAPEFPKASAERGQIAFYAAGNGNENAFLTPEQTYTSESLGPEWSVRVGAVTTGTRRPIVGTGKPVDIASFGSGDIPAADPTSVHGLGSHSGTSAATPYSAGVFGTVLAAAREALGDTGVGQRWGSDGVIARGTAIPGSPYLYDGVLTRTELMEAVFKTAQHETFNDGNFDILPPTTPPNDDQYLIGGRGIVEPASGARAREVLLGHAALPVRPQGEEDFYAKDASIRADLWGEWTGGGHNSSKDPGAPAASMPNPVAGMALGAAVTEPGPNAVLDPTVAPIRALKGRAVFPVKTDLPATPAKLYLHRTGGTACNDGAYTLDRTDSAGDRESACQFQPAQPAFDPVGLGFVEPYALVSSELPAVLTTKAPVTGTIAVRTISPSPAHTLHLTLRSGGAVVGETRVTKAIVSATATAPATFPFSIAVPAAFAGRPLGDLVLEIVQEQSTTAAATVLEGAAASFVNLPFVAPADRPANTVEVSVDDPGFANPIVVAPDVTQTAFADTLDVLSLPDGPHYLYARARQGTAVSPVRMHAITVRRTTPAGHSVVQVQVTKDGGALRPDGWANATDTSGHGDFATWASTLSIRSLKRGSYALHARVLDADGATTASSSVTFFRAPGR